jgi:hypothetical protein
MDFGYAKMWFVNYLIIVEIESLLNVHKKSLPPFEMVYQGIASGIGAKLNI